LPVINARPWCADNLTACAASPLSCSAFPYAPRPERDNYGRIKRSRSVLAEFKRLNPSPSTGERRACPGYVVDHVVPLACCGVDGVENMQWQTKADAKAKDKWERKACGATD
jgi:hypothetical protein